MSRLKDVLDGRIACSQLECDLHKLCLELEQELDKVKPEDKKENKVVCTA